MKRSPAIDAAKSGDSDLKSRRASSVYSIFGGGFIVAFFQFFHEKRFHCGHRFFFGRVVSGAEHDSPTRIAGLRGKRNGVVVDVIVADEIGVAGSVTRLCRGRGLSAAFDLGGRERGVVHALPLI